MEAYQLLTKLNKYICHSDKVYSNAYGEYTKSLSYTKILDDISFLKEMAQGLSMTYGYPQIFREILCVRNRLRHILPSHLNDSFDTSLQELNDIIAFCEDLIGVKEIKHE